MRYVQTMNNRCQTLHRNLHNIRAGMSIAIKTVTISPECEGRIATVTNADTKNLGAATAVTRNRFIIHHKAANTQPSAQTATSDRLHCVPLQEHACLQQNWVCLSSSRQTCYSTCRRVKCSILVSWAAFDLTGLDFVRTTAAWTPLKCRDSWLSRCVTDSQDNITNCLEEYSSQFTVNVDRC
jgi:hypothetical protein